ncbi:MAG: hypothetical protein AAB250_03375, partial [Bdellovibrionota bacterium]
LASPTVRPRLASDLARPLSVPTARSPSRILCLKLPALPQSGSKRRAKTLKAVSECFLKFSPRVSFREDAHNMWVFVDIASTSHLFQGEEGVMKSASLLARDLGFGVQCAVADTPAGAQAFAVSHPGSILPAGEERDRLKTLSLPLLLHMEGLVPWVRPTQVESILTFFLMLGFKTAGELARFTLASFQERWGETGVLFWQRLHAQDAQVISPLLPTEPLEDYVHLDFPVTLVSLLLHHTDKSLDYLFSRLSGRRLFARKLVVTLHCEFSDTKYKVEIEPNVPSRDRTLFATLLENRLSELDLLNPIRDFEMAIVPCPEKSSQLDFFEPRTTDQDKLQTLFSLLLQSSVKPGLYQIEAAVLPERAWRLVSEPKPDKDAASPVRKGGAIHNPPQRYPQLVAAGKRMRRKQSQSWVAPATDEPAVASQPKYGESVMSAPRPTRVLKRPQPLTIEELERLKILSTNPIERLENAWWEDSTENVLGSKRDYYFAVSSEGQCLWIYQDLTSDEYFLHGYFD